MDGEKRGGVVSKSSQVELTLGRWYWLDTPVRQTCCGCGLVHEWEFRVRGGKLEAKITEGESRKTAEKTWGGKVREFRDIPGGFVDPAEHAKLRRKVERMVRAADLPGKARDVKDGALQVAIERSAGGER